MSDLDRQIELLRNCQIIEEHEVKSLCQKAMEILMEESNVQRVDAPVTVSAPTPRASAVRCTLFPSARGSRSPSLLCAVRCSDLRRHPWAILRPQGALPRTPPPAFLALH